ncbi:4'-phosphopantetheinyl transferase family protein [Gloeobacter violaceus]|uniref:Phosphopantetheinyltransferase family protein n=1 Tax=Gloeobacter violaceus (strain ATCC 29082 / PCC 7421) TaxID=251221 RepID=Q7NJ81_GLOVI|nr:4'-phosphopantetheinyl transferase superfamily protein [Gloeobacter violaceus]BAC89892.1 phosphopantetheinyltransferase family protein [Gloeobacter violaceus PCC 7421]
MVAIEAPWRPTAAPPVLTPAAVHIWQADLDWPAAPLPVLERTLCPQERSRAERFCFEQHRRRFIVGRATLRMLLGLYLQSEPACVPISYGAHGKPLLADGAHPLRFNLSHSQGKAVYAFSCGREVGVDLEWDRPLANFDQLARVAFSEDENRVFKALAPYQRRAAFFRCWTRKEAYAKARGYGFALAPDRYTVSLAPDAPAALLQSREESGEAGRWVLLDLLPWPDYPAALAVEGSSGQVHCWHSPEPISRRSPR